MTPSPLDRKTKANEAEPRWRDRLVLTRLFYHSGIQNGATGGDAEATRVGLVRYDIKRPHAGSLYESPVRRSVHCLISEAVRSNTSTGVRWDYPTTNLYYKRDDKADMLVKLYLSFFSLSRAIKLAKRISPSLFASITDPMSDVQKFAEVRDWLRGLIRKLANRYLSQALSRPREYRGNRLGRLCQRIVSDLPCISIRNDAEAYIERISSLIYGHPLPDILVMNGMPLGEGFSSHYTCLTSEDTKGYPLPSGIKDSIPAWIKFSVQAPGEIPHKGIYYDPPEELAALSTFVTSQNSPDPEIKIPGFLLRTSSRADSLAPGDIGVAQGRMNEIRIQDVIAAENKHAVPGDWNPLRSAEQTDNRQKMLGKAAGLKSEADPMVLPQSEVREVLLLALVAGKRQPRGENEWLRNRLVPSGLVELLLGLS
ncbi:hypothetical protein V6N12_076030 [Hibiscus sabdariffa]|uniref:Uncharacterized protein n=1 Tax=Hibiscus sabdariffa TaxID=183260 RepID=A0ABR2AY31_9ROSI